MNKNKGLDALVNEFYSYAKNRLDFSDDIEEIRFLEDEENAQNPLGKTAYYEPSSRTIAVFTTGRHPKDILRSLSHELVHHKQNCEGGLNNVSGEPGYAQEGSGREAEKEAYLEGNLIFRDWEDEQKGDIKEAMTKKTLFETRREKLNNRIYEVFGFERRYSEDANIELDSFTLGMLRPWSGASAAAEMVRLGEKKHPIPIETAYAAIDELEEILQRGGSEKDRENLGWSRDSQELYSAIKRIKKALQTQGYM